ncbi:MAG: thymidine phosphorylase family protein [Pseudomonadota bacterium]
MDVHPATRLEGEQHKLRLKPLGIETSQEAVVFMREDCHICRSEGFDARARVLVRLGERRLIATLHVITSDLLSMNEASLSLSAWRRLDAQPGDWIAVSHPKPLQSLGHVRAKIYGKALDETAFSAIMRDIVDGQYSDIHLAGFLTACAADKLGRAEMLALTQAMIGVGGRLSWPHPVVVDKHCVGGLPGNRTTPIVVAIIAAAGLVMPKTSSRAITSPAGTADTMETLAPVDLSLAAMRRVVDSEGGCVVWGGSVRLSPADDILIRVERALDLDSEGQLVASVLSKKAAAGASHLLLDLPTGPTAKVRSQAAAEALAAHLIAVAGQLGMKARALISDGAQPVGRGIGPALEAWDVLAVLGNEAGAPPDLRARAVTLAGALLELAGKVEEGRGARLASAILDDGRAWRKFQAICQAQGGLRTPPTARHRAPVTAHHGGRVKAIDNRLLARAAKLAGAPAAPAAGLMLHKKLGDAVAKDEPLFTIHAETPGELAYALDFVAAQPPIIAIGEPS